MISPRSFLVPAFGCLLATTSCAQDRRDYPSLAPRAIEKLGFAEPEVAAVEATPDPALDATIAAKRQELARIAKGFAAAAAGADAAARAAKGQPAGSDRWIAAQALLAGLDDWRAQATALVTDIDQLTAGRAATLAPTYPALATLRDAAEAEAASEAATIARIEGSLPAA